MKPNYLALAANLLFAITFTLSCSSDDGGEMLYGCIKGACAANASPGTLQNPNMRFVNSAIPSGQNSYISNVRFNGSAVAGGSSSINFTSSQRLNELYLQVAGEGGYYSLELSGENIVSQDEGYVYSVPLQFSQQLEGGDLEFTVSGSMRTEDEVSVSASTRGSVQIIKAGTGALQITLSWDQNDDLDLHVYTPSEKHLYFGNRSVSATQGVGKAELDIDSNAGCSNGRNTENVYFESPLEDGVYSIRVNLYARCPPQRAGSGARYDVSVNSKGKLIANKNGKFADNAASQSWAEIGTITVRNGAVVQGNGWSSSSVVRSSSSVVRSSSSVARSSSSGGNLVSRCPIGSVSENSVTCDGQLYKTVVIGEQTWFAENLNYAAEGSKCYNNLDYNCETYGRLYNWATANAVCPEGWHLPSQEEWNALSSYVQSESGCSSCDAKLLKAASGWNDYNGASGNGTDEYSFSALAGGIGGSDGGFGSVGYYGRWWSASENENLSGYAYYRSMSYYGEDASQSYENKSYLFSVRCLQDRD